MAQKNTMMIVLIVVAVLIGWQMFSDRGAQAPVSGAPSNTVGGQPIVTSNPTWSVNGVDAANAGTSVASTPTVSVGGGAFGTVASTYVPGQTLNVLFTNGTSYHSAYRENIAVTTTTFPITQTFNKNASVTLTFFTTNNIVASASAAGGNQTTAAGGSYNNQLTFDGQSQTSTQDMICLLEGSNKTALSAGNPDGIVLSGNGAAKVNIPTSFYTIAGTNSQVYAYSIPAVNSAARVTYTVTTASASGKALAGSNTKITCYTKEYFTDPTTGKVVLDIQDSNGLLKSIASYTTSIHFV